MAVFRLCERWCHLILQRGTRGGLGCASYYYYYYYYYADQRLPTR